MDDRTDLPNDTDASPGFPTAGTTTVPGGVLRARFPKHAIVVVHGMGEKRPMDTIKAFVNPYGYKAALTNKRQRFRSSPI
ncbi:hypothetical protein [Rhizobium ruizarguesonis]|uniref:hypothetical protein n=1 Tax=Rhizobium ruizarguesonis TaxID=2081791 RepID=UPI0010322F54|nr:hypothetical protein [Rhizobium ruizarguesonis]TBD71605.1 hypothetical protein ELH11_38565 [Rhizobium ruizarguesonis]TBD94847.1 hypothetical protein ELH09_38285 [Rhizobium ruizarguesonis]TBE14535.1 hypothetical protein ELH07_38345 [Rhizobium ruizarguesonis]TBE14704.1 hypothetical protein ELH08_38890 [Rhizobium ruizarguesonis]WSH04971.1 hypothetical protein U8P71_34670 [Rhizobium ruizarguesonis]